MEAGLRLAKAATGRQEVIGFWGGFHGKTGGVLGLLGSDFKHHQGPFLPGQYSTPYADCYRCPLKLRYPDCGIACAEYVRDVIRYQTAGEIAAIIVEPIQGTAGNVIPPDGFLRAIQSVARDHGALLFADEMITGFGRTGSMWGTDHEGVVPDIMTVGKGVGGGFPLAGVVSTDDADRGQALVQSELQLVELRRQPARLGGGARRARDHPEGGPRRARPIASARSCSPSSQRLKEKYRTVGEVRGRGLLLGIELVEDRQSRKPLDKEHHPRPLPGVPAARPRGDDLLADDPASIRRSSSPRSTARAGLAILDEALGVVLKRHGRD